MAKSFDFQHAPGHLIRRAHQLAVAIFMEETAEFDVTPVQFAILNALIDVPGEDQVTLSGHVAFDAAILTHDLTRGLRLHTRIGKNCFVGARSIVLPGVLVGDGSIIGAGSVVIRNVPELENTCSRSRVPTRSTSTACGVGSSGTRQVK